MGSDLAEGLETFVESKDTSAVEDVLECINGVKYNLQEQKIDIVSFRNNFNKILATPYNRREPWAIGVRRKGSVLLFDVEDVREPDNQDPKFAYFGRRYASVYIYMVNSKKN